MPQPLQRRIVRAFPNPLLFGCHDRTLPGVVRGFGRFSRMDSHALSFGRASLSTPLN
jgi:hypothetical protein